jgi:hypothetical protein
MMMVSVWKPLSDTLINSDREQATSSATFLQRCFLMNLFAAAVTAATSVTDWP